MMSPWRISICLVLCLYASEVWCNGNWHIDSTPDTPQLTPNLYCEELGDDPYFLELNFVIYQSDLGFKYSDKGPEDGDYVEYELCYFINVDDFIDNDELYRANYTTPCGVNPSSVTFYSDGPTNDTTELDTIRTRTFSKSVVVPLYSNSSYCGSAHNSTTGESIFGVYCKRDNDYKKQFDYIFLIHYLIDGGDCEVFADTFTYHVNPAEVVNIDRIYEADLAAYETTSVNAWPSGPKSDSSDLINSAIDLGTLMYLEMCIDLPDPETTPGHKKFFRDDFENPIGMYAKKCYAYSVSNPNPGLKVEILDENCGLGVAPAEFWATDGGDDSNVFRYVKDSVDSVDDWFRGPNCFRSRVFTAVSFKRSRIFEASVMGFECVVEYCDSSTDPKCFGNRTLDREGYDGCTPGRKKRETFNTHGAPFVVSTTIKIAPLAVIPVQPVVSDDPCPESVGLISSASVLSVIFVIVFIIGSIMSYYVQSLSNQIHPKKRQLSVVDVHNAGYQ